MQILTRTRQHIRELVQANAFLELNRYFDALEARWLQTPPGEYPAYLEAIEGHMLVDWDVKGGKALSQFLKAWIEACPKAYHARVVMGFHCFNRARDICGLASAEPVTAERWLAAEQVCEIATAHLLRAMGQSTRPVAAAIGMLRISAHFTEPGWLLELFNGQRARFRPSAHADVEVQEAAAPFLVRYGLAPLGELPLALPAGLGKRGGPGDEGAGEYWLRHALAGFPGCFEAIEAYATSLAGSPEALEEVVRGPLCNTWSAAQRNAIRWLGLEHPFYLPHAEQQQNVAALQQVFADWSQRELRPKERATLLAWRGAFRRYSLHDYPGAMSDFVASVDAYPDQGYVAAVGEPFLSFVCLTVLHGQRDEKQSLRAAIERLCDSCTHAAACALRAVGHQFGWWGFHRSSELARAWSQAAVRRQGGREGQGFDVLDVPRLLWAGNLHEAAYYLYERCAELKLPEAATCLYDLHRGWLANTPERYIDSAAAEHWLLCAVESGSRVAKYTLARQRMAGAADLGNRTAMLAVRRLLVDALGDARIEAHARLHLAILLRQHGQPRERAEAVDYLQSLADDPDGWVAGRASAELGLAWMQGHGTRKQSRFAAIEWAKRAAALRPGDTAIEDIHAQILNSHSLFKTLFTVCGAALFRGTLHPSELPPTKAEQSPQACA
ncbi:DUF4034 domain-containing protein [Pseudomonas putida]